MAYMTDEQIDRIVEKIGLPQFTPNTINNKERLLSELAEIRNKGYAFDNEERRIGTSCIGVPIFDTTGKAVAAVSVSGPTSSMTQEKMLSLLPDISNVTAFLGRNSSEFPVKFP